MRRYDSPKSSIFLAGILEAEGCVSVLASMAQSDCAVTQWRMRPDLFDPLITAACGLLHDLVQGEDRESFHLHEFARVCYDITKRRTVYAEPKLALK